MSARILIVDDEVIVAESVKVTLAQLGYTVAGAAHSAAGALTAVERERPDLVLMDINLSAAGEGIEAADTIRRRHGVPVVFVTAYSDDDTVARAKLSHPFGYVTKPFAARDLQIAIEIALHNHALEQRLQRSEQSLRERERRERAILDTMADPAWLLDREGRYLAVNRAWCEFFGQAEPQAIGRTAVDVFSGAGAALNHELTMGVFVSGESVRREEAIAGADRQLAWYETCRSPLRNESGEIVGVVGIARNITPRKVAEVDLADQAEMYRTLLSTTLDGMIETDEDQHLLDVNAAYCRLTGYTREELLRMRIQDLEFNETPAEVAEHTLKMIREGGARFEAQHRTKDGWPIDLEISITHLRARGRFVAFFHDITERRATAETQHFLASCGQAPGEEFFAALARFLAQQLDADHVCIDCLEGDGVTARTLAGWTEHRQAEKFTYALKDTPGGAAIEQNVCCYPRAVCQAFPHDATLRELRAESYVGIALRGHKGQPIGVIAAISRRSLVRPTRAELVLKLVAGRAAGELDRRRVDEALRASELRFQSVWEHSVDGMRITDAEGKLVAVNGAYCRLVGRSKAEVENQPFTVVYDPDAIGPQAEVLQRYREKFAARNIPVRQERKAKFADGRTVELEVTNSLLELPDGRVLLLGLHRDVTERKRAEREVVMKQARLRQAQRLAQLGFWEWNPTTDETFWSDEMLRVYGITREEFTGRGQDYLEFTHPDDRAMQAENIRSDFEQAHQRAQVIRTGVDGVSDPKEFRIVRRNGEVRWVRGDAVEEVDDQGRPLRMVGILQDITARKAVEDELRRTSRWLLASQRISATGGWALNLNTGEVWASPEARRIYGTGDGVLTVEDIVKFPLPEFRPLLDRAMRELIEQGKPYDLEFKIMAGADGTTRHVHSQGELNREENLVLGVVHDVTKRNRSDEALRESEEKFAKAFRDSPVAMAIRDLQSDRYVEINARCLSMLGYDEKEVIGKTPLEVGWMDAADRSNNERVMTTPDVSEQELRLRHRDGHPVTVSYTSHQVRIGGRPCLLSITLDITERKRLEQERERLIRALERKNRESENLVYVASHDLRTPMLNIQGFSGRLAEIGVELSRLMAREPDAASRAAMTALLQERMPRALGFIGTSVTKMDRLITGLLRLSRLGRAGLVPESVDPNAIFAEILGTMAFTLQAAGAVVEIGSLPRCWGDPGQINQLFSNLLDNAIKYRDPARPLHLTVTGWQEGQRCVYCVADTGIGIAAKDLEKIWEIFFRVDPGGAVSGEGLGLNLVHRIVERHQGEIWLESVVGEGTRFYVALPTPRHPDTPSEGLA